MQVRDSAGRIRPCVVFAANRGYALKSSREGIIRHFLDDGWRVVLVTADDRESRALVGMGAELEPVVFSRGGFAPLLDMRAYRRFLAVMRQYSPVLLHNFHAKPVILGTRAARKAMGRSVKVVNTITGLGHAFIKGGLIAWLASAGYRSSLSKADMTIFQNPDDRALFLAHRWLSEERSQLIVGSGVDLQRFTLPESGRGESDPLVVMMGRLIWQKGVEPFSLVARAVRRRWPQARFVWAGELDPVHPDAVPEDWLGKQADFEYIGRISDVPSLLASADLLLFPSYYREGVPRTVMEAAACGLPTVAYDVPGVREAVRDGETGYLVPAKHVQALAQCVETLLEDKALRIRMGRQARQMAEEAFDIRQIQSEYFAVYRQLNIKITPPRPAA